MATSLIPGKTLTSSREGKIKKWPHPQRGRKVFGGGESVLVLTNMLGASGQAPPPPRIRPRSCSGATRVRRTGPGWGQTC